MMRRGPGLIGMAARTAVVAGTATAVSGRVARRQANRYADQDAQYVQQQTAAATQGAYSTPRAGRRGRDRADPATGAAARVGRTHG